jgi:hypothetical protein
MVCTTAYGCCALARPGTTVSHHMTTGIHRLLIVMRSLRIRTVGRTASDRHSCDATAPSPAVTVRSSSPLLSRLTHA